MRVIFIRSLVRSIFIFHSLETQRHDVELCYVCWAYLKENNASKYLTHPKTKESWPKILTLHIENSLKRLRLI